MERLPNWLNQLGCGVGSLEEPMILEVSGAWRTLEVRNNLIHGSLVEIQALPLGIEVRTLHRRQDHTCLIFRISHKEQLLARSAILKNRGQYG